MKLEENFIESGTNVLLSDWGHKGLTLKHKYNSEYTGSLKTYKLTKEQLEEYLRTGIMPEL